MQSSTICSTFNIDFKINSQNSIVVRPFPANCVRWKKVNAPMIPEVLNIINHVSVTPKTTDKLFSLSNKSFSLQTCFLEKFDLIAAM